MNYRFSGAVAAGAALTLALYACSEKQVQPLPADDAGSDAGATGNSFGEGFLFGTAIAGFQADMGCPTLGSDECDDRNSDWFAFATSPVTQANPGLHLSNQDPRQVSPGFWETYEADLTRARDELGNNSFRMSFEWSRLFPTAADGVEGYEALKAIANPKAVERYHAMLRAMKARGIKPLVTVNHYALPSWIHDAVGCYQSEACADKGWADKARIVREIAKYAGFLGREYGAEVDLWATLNEPMAVVFPGYILQSATRTNPPGVSRPALARAVHAAMVEAHARMYDALKAADTADADGDGSPAQVGTVLNVLATAPKDPASALDREAADNVYYLWNTAFLDGVALGQYDATLSGAPEARPDLAGRLDYLGINYYGRALISGAPGSILPDLSPKATFVNFETEAVYPAGLQEVVERCWERYKKPIYLTENGAEVKPTDAPASVESFLVQNLGYLRRAMKNGVDVRGYYYWSLMDNFEWNHGMNMRFGLYAVEPDDKTRARTARPGAAVYARIAKANAIPDDLAAKYPLP